MSWQQLRVDVGSSELVLGCLTTLLLPGLVASVSLSTCLTFLLIDLHLVDGCGVAEHVLEQLTLLGLGRFVPLVTGAWLREPIVVDRQVAAALELFDTDVGEPGRIGGDAALVDEPLSRLHDQVRAGSCNALLVAGVVTITPDALQVHPLIWHRTVSNYGLSEPYLLVDPSLCLVTHRAHFPPRVLPHADADPHASGSTVAPVAARSGPCRCSDRRRGGRCGSACRETSCRQLP